MICIKTNSHHTR